jgi:hypothetical protein
MVKTLLSQEGRKKKNKREDALIFEDPMEWNGTEQILP